MAKILLYTDPHFCSATSVIRGKGDKYSIRIEKILDTLRWIEEEGNKRGVDDIICLGDFFDSPNLNAEEITAISSMDLSKHKFIVGNHDAVREDLSFNSINIFNTSKIYDKPGVEIYGDTQIVMLPYTLDSARKELKDILDELGIDDDKKIVILSHNDIKNVQYGKITSSSGYDKDDIIANSDLFINGHIHTGGWVFDTILNLGSVTGVNFNNNAFYWKPVIGILDTETLEIELVENPHAFLFYKLYFKEVGELKEFIDGLDNSKYNILNAKMPYTEVPNASEVLKQSNLYYSRIISDYLVGNKNKEVKESVELIDTSMNYYDRFKEFVKISYGENELFLNEIDKIAER